MNFLKRLCGYAEPPTSQEEPLHEDSHIIKRNLIRSHRARLFEISSTSYLVEDLLLAAEVSSRTQKVSAPSIECILGILSFSQKMKWLCDWGLEYIDETLRPPSASLPKYIEQKITDRRVSGAEWATHEEVLDILNSPSQNLDRIILTDYDPEYISLLPLHSFEELYLEFQEIELTIEDMENIAKCTSLRLFNMGYNRTSVEGMQALRKLPNLQQFKYDESAEPFQCIQALMQLPQLNLLQINVFDGDENYNPATCPFGYDEIDEALAYIRDRKDTARQLRMSVATGPVIFDALSRCTNLESIHIEDVEMLEDSDIHLLFSSPALQRTVRHIHLCSAVIDEEAAAYLSMFTNLLWIDFDDLDTTTAEIVPVILANANHLQSLHIERCRDVGDEILDAIAQCKRLQVVHLENNGVSLEAFEAYRDAKRANWEVITFKKVEPRQRGDSAYWCRDEGEESYEYLDSESAEEEESSEEFDSESDEE